MQIEFDIWAVVEPVRFCFCVIGALITVYRIECHAFNLAANFKAGSVTGFVYHPVNSSDPVPIPKGLHVYSTE